jgi:hypothetical protein
VKTTTAKLKAGPYADCSTVTALAEWTDFYLHCEYTNIYGNLWYYVRLKGTSTYGWVYDGDVDAAWIDEDNDGWAYQPECG